MTNRHMVKANVVTWLVGNTRNQQWFYARQAARDFAKLVCGSIHEEWIAIAQEA